MVVICGVHIDDDVEDEQACTYQVGDVVVRVLTKLLIDPFKRQSQRDSKGVEDGNQEDQDVPGEFDLVIGSDQEIAREHPLGECRFFLDLFNNWWLRSLLILIIRFLILGIELFHIFDNIWRVQLQIVHELDFICLSIKLA